MKPAANFQFSRRSLLRAAGSTLLVPTFLKQAFAQTVTTTPNLVLLMQTNGTHQASFWPVAGTWTSPILDPILSDPVVGPKTTLVSGIYLNKAGSPGGDGHDWGWHGLYSGMDNIAGGGGQFGGGPSVDQILIKNLTLTAPFTNLHVGVNAANYQLINAGRASWVCESAGLQVPVEIDIYALYTKVFGSLTTAPTTTTTTTATPASIAATAAATQRLAQRKSVLDTVAADLQTLEGRLGTAERAKVDVHLQAIRDFETRLSSTITTGGTTGRPVMCSTVQPSMMGVPSTGQGNEANAPELFTLFMEFIANAIGCNMVSIMTFQAGRGGEHFHYSWLNLPGMQPDFHNDIAHKDGTNDSTSGTPGGVMLGVAQYQAKMVLSLAQKLAAFPQANGKTALDNALVVYGNELATGPHGTVGYPIAFLGGAAGKLSKTGYMVSSGTQMHQRLGCTIENIMGMTSAGFGSQPACGVFQGLSLA
jgi:hypothetical protein